MCIDPGPGPDPVHPDPGSDPDPGPDPDPVHPDPGPRWMEEWSWLFLLDEEL